MKLWCTRFSWSIHLELCWQLSNHTIVIDCNIAMRIILWITLLIRCFETKRAQKPCAKMVNSKEVNVIIWILFKFNAWFHYNDKIEINYNNIFSIGHRAKAIYDWNAHLPSFSRNTVIGLYYVLKHSWTIVLKFGLIMIDLISCLLAAIQEGAEAGWFNTIHSRSFIWDIRAAID